MRIGQILAGSSIVIFIIFSLSCSGKKVNSGTEASIAGIGKDEDIQKVLFDARLLEGVWWIDTNNVSALFFITHDSLYYTEQQDMPYAIAIKGDTLKLNREDFASFFKLKKLTGDSLIFYDFSTSEDIKLFKKKE